MTRYIPQYLKIFFTHCVYFFIFAIAIVLSGSEILAQETQISLVGAVVVDNTTPEVAVITYQIPDGSDQLCYEPALADTTININLSFTELLGSGINEENMETSVIGGTLNYRNAGTVSVRAFTQGSATTFLDLTADGTDGLQIENTIFTKAITEFTGSGLGVGVSDPLNIVISLTSLTGTKVSFCQGSLRFSVEEVIMEDPDDQADPEEIPPSLKIEGLSDVGARIVNTFSLRIVCKETEGGDVCFIDYLPLVIFILVFIISYNIIRPILRKIFRRK